jgi:hypothetical protein
MASNPLYAIIWLILLLFIAWPIASLLAIVWIVLQVRRTGVVIIGLPHPAFTVNDDSSQLAVCLV